MIKAIFVGHARHPHDVSYWATQWGYLPTEVLILDPANPDEAREAHALRPEPGVSVYIVGKHGGVDAVQLYELIREMEHRGFVIRDPEHDPEEPGG